MCTANIRRNPKISPLMILPLDFKPCSTDILCGRGNVFSSHDGNQYFQRLIRENLESYDRAPSRPEKIKVVDEILSEIRLNGGRFAKLDSKTKQWYELNDVQAHQKIGHAIRDTIRLLKDKNKSIVGQQSRIAKRQRKRKSTLMMNNNVRPSTETRKKTMDDIIRISLDTVEFLNDVWGDEMESAKPESPQIESLYTQYCDGKRNFLLENEYPEETFRFSPGFFFDSNRPSQ